MEDSEQQLIKRRKLFLGLLYFAAFVVIVALWILVSSDRTPENEIAVRNYDNKTLDLPDRVKSAMQKKLYETIDLAYGIDKEKQPIANVRTDSIELKESANASIYNFLVDIDAYELTYYAKVMVGKNRLNDQVIFYCPTPDQSKYPKHFCVGYAGHSTISVTIGDALPLEAKQTKNGYYYDVSVVQRKNSISSELQIYSSACNDAVIENEILEDLRAWIANQGYDPEIYPISFVEGCPKTEL